MKTEKNILIAFILNALFSIFELIGGLFTNSISIISDAIHDFGDAISIGISYLLEKKSKKKPDKKYTYGYLRYAVLGALITTSILIISSIIVITEAIKRLINPIDINHNGMIIFAIFGVIVNSLAIHFTKEGDSLNQKAVNLHMMEDVLGWIIVLIGALLIKFTDITIIDPIMSIIVSTYILINALKNLKNIIDIFLEKTPNNISIDKISKQILALDNVKDIHHIHIWTIDGYNNYATMHIVTTKNNHDIKDNIRKILNENNIKHITIELENNDEICHEKDCNLSLDNNHHHHHHNH